MALPHPQKNHQMNSLSLSAAMRRIVLEAFILCVLSAVVGLSLNFKMIFNAFSGKSVSVPAPIEEPILEMSGETVAFPMPVDIDELDELMDSGAIFVDSRNSAAFEENHLAGALSFPHANHKDSLAEFKSKVSTNTTLVVYCSGYGCTDSFDLGMVLMTAGYDDVLVYEGGFPEWRDAGRRLEGGQE